MYFSEVKKTTGMSYSLCIYSMYSFHKVPRAIFYLLAALALISAQKYIAHMTVEARLKVSLVNYQTEVKMV